MCCCDCHKRLGPTKDIDPEELKKAYEAFVKKIKQGLENK